MDDEKLQRTIDFILENQAQFYADLQQVQETNKQIQETQKEAEKRANILERVCLNLYNTMIEEGKHISELREAQKQTDARFKETDERFKETDERLNAVILMAERFLGGQNGKSQ